jgi:hypothetical protein
MLCFQVVKTVLDELYARIDLPTDEQKDQLIKQRLKYLGQIYNNLPEGLQVDHSDIATRFAYIQRYVTCHANLVYQAIEGTPELGNLFDASKVHMTCLGGGPGSELVGVLKFLLVNDKNPRLHCTLYDKEKRWGECWSDLADKVGSTINIQTHCESMDVLDSDDWGSNVKYLQSDLFTMIYFLSEIEAKRAEAEPFFHNLFDKAKPGAFFLFIDNKHTKYYGWFDELIEGHSFEVIKSYTENMRIDDLKEQKVDLGVYFDKFGHPKLTANAALRFCKKV